MSIFKNRVALITGASGEIGKELAIELNKKGASIILAGRRREVLNNIGKNLEGDVKIIDESIDNFSNFENALLSFDAKIDILINNAGITKDNLLIRMSEDDIDDVINVILNSLIKITKFALKNMMKNKFGRIISISSVVGFKGNPGQANYCASKSGIIGFTKSLALEVASRGITVNAIAPGFISSAMTDKLTEDQREKIITNIPVNRLGTPKDVANAVIFLAKEDSSYIVYSNYKETKETKETIKNLKNQF